MTCLCPSALSSKPWDYRHYHTGLFKWVLGIWAFYPLSHLSGLNMPLWKYCPLHSKLTSLLGSQQGPVHAKPALSPRLKLFDTGLIIIIFRRHLSGDAMEQEEYPYDPHTTSQQMLLEKQSKETLKSHGTEWICITKTGAWNKRVWELQKWVVDWRSQCKL